MLSHSEESFFVIAADDAEGFVPLNGNPQGSFLCSFLYQLSFPPAFSSHNATGGLFKKSVIDIYCPILQ